MIGKPDKLCPLKYSKRSLYLLGEIMSDNSNKEDDMKAEDEKYNDLKKYPEVIHNDVDLEEGENIILNKKRTYYRGDTVEKKIKSKLQALKEEVNGESLESFIIELIETYDSNIDDIKVQAGLIQEEILNLITNLEDK